MNMRKRNDTLRRWALGLLALVLTVSAAPAAGATQPETLPAETQEGQWQGFDVGAHLEEISFKIAIQIGDTGFNQLGFSQVQSDRYIASLSGFADRMAEKGVRVISAPAPTAVGVMIEEEYLPMLNCASQKQMQNYLHEGMSDNVLKVDVFSNMVQHNGEYLYFRTDHHWTALGAYYAYEALCNALELTPTPLENFEEWDQGAFAGSLYGRVRYPNALREDQLVAYVPPADITMTVYWKNPNHGQQKPVIGDYTKMSKGSRYSAFLSGESILTVLENNDMAEGPSCIVVKDSFGNCYVPYLTEHYKTIYAVDYRIYRAMTLEAMVDKYGIDDVIFAPYMIATQATDGNDFFKTICR